MNFRTFVTIFRYGGARSSWQFPERGRSNVQAGSMRVALHALRELRAAGLLPHGKPGSEPIEEVVGLLVGALLGGALWILLLHLV